MATLQQAECRALQLMVHFRLDDYDFGFNRRRQGCGLCRFVTAGRRGRIELSIHFVLLNAMEEIDDTIRHEIAHAIAFRHSGHTGHGPAWVAACVETGAKANRTCSDVNMPRGKLVATCPSCCREYRRFKRPRRGTLLYCRPCGHDRGLLVFKRTA